VPKDNREADLRRLGLSSGLIDLAMGRRVPRLFSGYTAPSKVYGDALSWKSGLTFVPLWERYSSDAAAGLEFFRFSIEQPNPVRVLATSELGFFARLFFFHLQVLYDNAEGNELPLRPAREVSEAVKALGFLHYQAVKDAYLRHQNGVEDQERAIGRVVTAIDRDTTTSAG
jgi:hypothetical protein